MRSSSARIPVGFLVTLTYLFAGSVPAFASAHTWRINELFSNADGTIQFIEVKECCGSPNEILLGGKDVESTATGNIFVFPANLALGTTANKHILLATAGFAALPGAPTPDHIIPDNFFDQSADSVTYYVYDTMTFAAGVYPLDGVSSLQDTPAGFTVGPNSPTNCSGATGSVDAGGGPPTVTVTFDLSTSSVGELDTTHQVTIHMDTSGGATTEAIVADLSDGLLGSATSGSDYAAFPAQTVTFPIGSVDGDVQSVGVDILDDAVSEGDETIVLALDAVSGAGATLGAVTSHAVTIIDNEPPPPVGEFVRGDANQDGQLNIGDPIRILNALFGGQPTTCEQTLDANDDELSNIADPVFVLAYLFTMGPSPQAPFPACGSDPSAGALSCVSNLFCP